MTLSELPLEEDHAAALLHDAFCLALAEHKITAILKNFCDAPGSPLSRSTPLPRAIHPVTDQVVPERGP